MNSALCLGCSALSVSKPCLHPWDAQACLEWCLVSQSPSLAWLRQNGISQCETSTHTWENFQVGCILGKCHEELNLSILAPRSLVSWNLNDVCGTHLESSWDVVNHARGDCSIKNKAGILNWMAWDPGFEPWSISYCDISVT